MDTGTAEAAVSGTPLFFMTALVAVPPELPESEWLPELQDAASHANVDVNVTPAEKA
jgi:glycine cleavage system regulatory protein